jgi:hypothetical protein
MPQGWMRLRITLYNDACEDGQITAGEKEGSYYRISSFVAHTDVNTTRFDNLR